MPEGDRTEKQKNSRTLMTSWNSPITENCRPPALCPCKKTAMHRRAPATRFHCVSHQGFSSPCGTLLPPLPLPPAGPSRLLALIPWCSPCCEIQGTLSVLTPPVAVTQLSSPSFSEARFPELPGSVLWGLPLPRPAPRGAALPSSQLAACRTEQASAQLFAWSGSCLLLPFPQLTLPRPSSPSVLTFLSEASFREQIALPNILSQSGD